MIPILSLFAAAAAAASLAACQQPPDDKGLGDKAFGDRVHAYLLAHPEVIREAVEKLNENERQAATKAAGAAIGKYREQLERDPRDFVANPDGAVTVVEFFDYRCGYCKLAAPEVVKLIQGHPEIRFVFKEFPIFGAVSDTAARIALTAPAKAKGLDLYNRLMLEKNLTDATLDAHLTAAGLDPAALRAQAKSPEIAKQIADARDLARDLKIEGTPAFIVGDILVPGADMNALNAAIAATKGGKSAS
jgi:protein-disulfide isomerase